MKKIVFYINILGYGGAERVVSNLANQFAKQGDKVFVVTSYSVEQEYVLNNNVERIVLMEKGEDYFVLKKNYVLVKRLRKIVKKEKPDVVVSFMAEPNFRTLFACIGTNTKTLLSVRNSPAKEYAGKWAILAKLFFGKADGVVFQTEEAKNWFHANLKSKSRIILNQVDEKFYINDKSNGAVGIVTVGRLSEQKNHKMLIDAFNKIKNQVSDNLYIYGEGPMYQQLDEKIKQMHLRDRVFLMGCSDKIDKELIKYRLFVLSSDYEGLPNALMEAMATGLACISTDCECGGPDYLFGKKGKQYLCNVKDIDKMADLMLELLENENERIENSELMREQAKHFMPKVVFEQWDEYINDLICN